MKVEVWSDFVCPFCYIGKRKFELALEQFAHKQYVNIEYKSYQLAPDADRNPRETYYEFMAKKFNISVEEAITNTAHIVSEASEIGLIYRFDTMQLTNTYDAHRLTKLAAKKGLGVELAERILKAQFTDSEHIGDHAILIRIACEIGLDRNEVETLLGSCKYKSIVQEDQDQAKELGVDSVPFFIFNEKYALSGVQSPELFLEVLQKVWEEAGEKPTWTETFQSKMETSYCCGDDDRCGK